jgi:hypothetical protein
MRAYRIFIFLLALLAAQACSGQTDVGASIYGAFSGATGPTDNGNNTLQIPADSAGGLLEFRHIFNAALGLEATYSYNRANQVYRNYSFGGPASQPFVCPSGPTCPVYGPSIVSVSANAHEFTADWIPSKTTGALRPFAVLGGGIIIDVPSSGQSNTTTATSPVFVFGLGMDWAHWKRFGLRFQYRGNLYSAPVLTTQYYASTGSPMLTNEPMIGVYFGLP